MTTKAYSVYSSDRLATYTVVVEWNGSDLKVSCDCKAGSLGDWCRHKSSLLKGDETVLTTNDDLTEVLQWVKSSPIHGAITDIEAAEVVQKEAESTLKIAKAKVQAAKRVAASLLGSHRKR